MWRLLAQFIVFVFALAFLSNIFAAAWLLLGPGSGIASSSPALMLASSLASVAAVFASLWLAGRFLDRRPIRDFGFRLSGGWLLDLGFGLFLGALLMTGVFLTELAFGWVTVAGSFDSPGAPFWLGILLPLAFFACVGVYEETLSRGYQLRNLAEGLNYPFLGGPKGAVLVAWLLSSAFFGLLHFKNPNIDPLALLNIALAGLLLGVGYVLTGELAIPIGVHIAWNFFQGSVFGFPVSGIGGFGASFLTVKQNGPDLWTGGVFGPEGGLLDPLAVAIGISLTFLWVRLRHGRAAVHAPIAEGPPKRETSSLEA